MTNQELERAQAELRAIGADWALLTSNDNVTYVSHYEVPINFGALATLSYVEPMALINAHGDGSFLLVSGFYASPAQAQHALDLVISHAVFSGDEAVDGQKQFLESLRAIFREAGVSGKLAVEQKTLPGIVHGVLQKEYAALELIEADDALKTARRIKTPRELDLLRAAADVNKAGHEALRRETRATGKNEFELWSAVMTAMERKAGHTLYVFGELVTGTRCRAVNYPGGPKEVIPQAGDLALMDMSPRVNGYWSDCTNTMVVGGEEPTPKQKRYGVAAREAFHAAAEQLRPGKRASDAYAAAKATFEGYGLQIGHYAGHQIGAAVNETPRLVPYDHTPIEAGMVFSIEPGAYEGAQGEVGARMEKSVIVHASGTEIICDFEWGF